MPTGFLLITGAIIIFFFFFFWLIPVGLWVSALAAGVKVSIGSLVGMRLRRVPPAKIILNMIKADKAGIPIDQNQVEAHFLAGGNVDRVVDSLIAADKARIALPFDRAAAIDLAGRNVLDAVKVSVNPRWVTPSKTRSDQAALKISRPWRRPLPWQSLHRSCNAARGTPAVWYVESCCCCRLLLLSSIFQQVVGCGLHQPQTHPSSPDHRRYTVCH